MSDQERREAAVRAFRSDDPLNVAFRQEVGNAFTLKAFIAWTLSLPATRFSALVALLLLAPLLGSCVTTGPESVVGGECKFLQRPAYAVRGLRQYDQDWIDSTIEGGVGACGWQRPAPRPAELDAVPPKQTAHVKRAKSVKKHKHRILWHMRAAWPRHKVAPVLVTPPAPSVPAPVPPQRPIDLLLGVVGK